MPQQRIGHADIALGIFEVNRIDLVRHGRGSNLAGLESLPEKTQRDIAPDVAIQIQHHGVGAGQGIEHLGQRIMRFDLNGVGVELQPECLDKALGERLPVECRIGHQMGVVVAHSAVDLAQQFHPRQGCTGALQAIGDIGHLLAQGGRRSGLTVGAREHGNGGLGMRHVAQLLHQRIQRRQQHRVAAIGQRQRPGQVVDVLGGTGKVDELTRGAHLLDISSALAQPVFDRLHIMIGLRLDGLDARAIGLGELLHQIAQQRDSGGRERRQLDNRRLGRQGDQPLHLDLHPIAHQPGLAEIGSQGIHLRRIASVKRGDGSQAGERRGHEEQDRLCRETRRETREKKAQITLACSLN